MSYEGLRVDPDPKLEKLVPIDISEEENEDLVNFIFSKIPKANDILPKPIIQEKAKQIFNIKFLPLPNFEGKYPSNELLQPNQPPKTEMGSLPKTQNGKNTFNPVSNNNNSSEDDLEFDDNFSCIFNESNTVYKKYNKYIDLNFQICNISELINKQHTQSSLVQQYQQQQQQTSQDQSPDKKKSAEKQQQQQSMIQPEQQIEKKFNKAANRYKQQQVELNDMHSHQQIQVENKKSNNKKTNNNDENNSCISSQDQSQSSQISFASIEREQQKDDLQFESRFESGNLSMAAKVSSNEYNLLLQNDINSKGFTQWFFFCVSNTKKNTSVKFNIVNLRKPNSLFNQGMKILVFSAQKSSLCDLGWHRSCTEISYYRNNYYRYSSDKCYCTLTFTYNFEYDQDTIYFAYNYPYTYTRLQQYLQELEQNPQKSRYISRKLLCTTIAGNRCDLLTITDPNTNISEEAVQALNKNNKQNHKQQSDHRNITHDHNFEDKNKLGSKSNVLSLSKQVNKKEGVFFSARVHPGETVSSFVIQGVIDFLVGESNEAAMLREKYIFKIVPMLNPDGVIHGNYRCSLSGHDLNRKWQQPSRVLYPEIYYAKKCILGFAAKNKLVFVCDLHGHSMKKNIFCYGCNDVDDPFACRELPYLLSKLYQPFSYQDCNFFVQKSKEGTARVELWQNLKIPNIFTIESSFCGPSYNQVHFSPPDFLVMGQRLCEALLVYFNPPASSQTIDVASLTTASTISEKLTDLKQASKLKNSIDCRQLRSSIMQELHENKHNLQIGMRSEDDSDSQPSDDDFKDEEIKHLLNPIDVTKEKEKSENLSPPRWSPIGKIPPCKELSSYTPEYLKSRGTIKPQRLVGLDNKIKNKNSPFVNRKWIKNFQRKAIYNIDEDPDYVEWLKIQNQLIIQQQPQLLSKDNINSQQHVPNMKNQSILQHRQLHHQNSGNGSQIKGDQNSSAVCINQADMFNINFVRQNNSSDNLNFNVLDQNMDQKKGLSQVNKSINLVPHSNDLHDLKNLNSSADFPQIIKNSKKRYHPLECNGIGISYANTSLETLIEPDIFCMVNNQNNEQANLIKLEENLPNNISNRVFVGSNRIANLVKEEQNHNSQYQQGQELHLQANINNKLVDISSHQQKCLQRIHRNKINFSNICRVQNQNKQQVSNDYADKKYVLRIDSSSTKPGQKLLNSFNNQRLQQPKQYLSSQQQQDNQQELLGLQKQQLSNIQHQQSSIVDPILNQSVDQGIKLPKLESDNNNFRTRKEKKNIKLKVYESFQQFQKQQQDLLSNYQKFQEKVIAAGVKSQSIRHSQFNEIIQKERNDQIDSGYKKTSILKKRQTNNMEHKIKTGCIINISNCEESNYNSSQFKRLQDYKSNQSFDLNQSTQQDNVTRKLPQFSFQMKGIDTSPKIITLMQQQKRIDEMLNDLIKIDENQQDIEYI